VGDGKWVYQLGGSQTELTLHHQDQHTIQMIREVHINWNLLNACWWKLLPSKDDFRTP
jgi:hypothetical protein